MGILCTTLTIRRLLIFRRCISFFSYLYRAKELFHKKLIQIHVFLKFVRMPFIPKVVGIVKLNSLLMSYSQIKPLESKETTQGLRGAD